MPELFCDRCHRDYPCWFTHNDLWNKIVQVGDGAGGFLCPTCFGMVEMQMRGEIKIWKFVPDSPDEAYQDALDRIPIYNRPHPFNGTGEDYEQACYTCDREQCDKIHI